MTLTSNLIRNIIIAVITAALFAFFFSVRSILFPFIMGMFVAYLLDPLTDKLTEKRIPRSLASGITLTIFLLVIMFVLSLLLPLLKSQLIIFSSKIPTYLNAIWRHLQPLLDNVKEMLSLHEDGTPDLKSILANNSKEIIDFTVHFITRIITNGVALFNVIGLIFITPIVAYYLLNDWKNFLSSCKSLIPRRHSEEVLQVFSDMDKALAGFIRGQLSVCCIMALYYAVALSAIRLDVAVAIGVFTGLMTAIPYIGWTLGAACGISVAIAQFADSPTRITLVVLVFLGGQLLESCIFTPKLVGSSIGVHPIWIMFALLAGGVLFGFVGVLLAVPLAAILGVLVRYAFHKLKA